MKDRLDNLGVSAFCESMAMMVQSGIQTDEAVSLLAEGAAEGKKEGPLHRGLVLMTELLEQGKGLAAAMRESGCFPDYALDMVEAGESSGRLEDVLFRLSRYYAEQKTIADKLRSAVTYPAAMLLLIIAVLAAMLLMVLPAFTGVYDKLTGSLAVSGYGYVRWAYAFCWAALIVMLVLAALLIAGLLLWRGGHRETVERVLRRIPITAGILNGMGMFRFTSALSTFLASGEMQDEAMKRAYP